MKQSEIVTSLTLIALLIGGLAFAEQDDQTTDRKSDRASRQGGERRQRGGESGGQRGREGGGKGQKQPGMQEAMIARIVTNPRIAKEIGLTEDQVTTLKDANTSMREKQIDLRAELEKIVLRQADLLTAADLEEKAIMKILDQKYDVMKQMEGLRIKTVLLVRKTLTTEQIQKIKEMMKKRMSQRGRGRGEGEGGRGEGRQGRRGGEGEGQGERKRHHRSDTDGEGA